MTPRLTLLAMAATAAILLPGSAAAVDGTRLIDQARALAGGLTPGDAAGFPVTISQSGSYRLSGNLTVPDTNTTAIVITADNVTLDLNGFAIIGSTACPGQPPVCAPTGSGVGVHSEQSYIAVRNGMVRGMGSHGILLNRPAGAGSTTGHLVSDLQVSNNGGDGISTGAGIVRNSFVRRNGGRGITIEGGLVTDNTINLNAGIGVRIAGTGAVSRNNVTDNFSCGISVNSGLVSGNNLLQNNGGLCLSTAGYLGNTLISNNSNALGGLNLGQNLCASLGVLALCP